MDWILVWTALGAIASCILAIGVIVAIWQIIVTRQNTRKSTNAQLAVELFRELRSDRALNTIRYIYKLPFQEDGKHVTSDHEHSIEYVFDRLDLLSILVNQSVVDFKLAADSYAGVTVLRIWYILHMYIWNIREERKYYGDSIESFTHRCIKYFKRNSIEVGFKPYTDEDLVKILLYSKDENDDTKRILYPRSAKEIKQDRKNKIKSNTSLK